MYLSGETFFTLGLGDIVPASGLGRGLVVLESHLSYPVLSYYRSQPDNQSWLTALTTILDASALVIVGVEHACARQAGLTFAMARHTGVDLAPVLGRAPIDLPQDRLPASELARLRAGLAATGVVVAGAVGDDDELAELRRMDEPFVTALSHCLLMPLPGPARRRLRARELAFHRLERRARPPRPRPVRPSTQPCPPEFAAERHH